MTDQFDNTIKQAYCIVNSEQTVNKMDDLESKNNALHKTVDELSLSLSSSENATETIQIMLENSQEENKSLKKIIKKMTTGIDLPFTKDEMHIVNIIQFGAELTGDILK